MIEVAAEHCAEFISHGEALLLFSATWSLPGQALERVLGDVGRRLPSLRMGRVDIDRQTPVVNAFHLTACPTCEVYVEGQVRARLVGTATAETMLQRLMGAGLTPAGKGWARLPAFSTVIEPAMACMELIDQLDEHATVAAIIDALSTPPTAYTHLAGERARELAPSFAPAYFACIRELPLLVRHAIQEVRGTAAPIASRAGLASALCWLAVDHRCNQGSCTELLADWLVLQAARLQFHRPPASEAEVQRMATAGAFVAAALPPAMLRKASEVATGLAHVAEALSGAPEDDAEDILAAQLAGLAAAPGGWAPPVVALTGHERQTAARLASAWTKTAVGLGYPGAQNVWLRFSDGTSVAIAGHSVLVHG